MLNKQERVNRAKKAAAVAAENRRQATSERNRLIRLAYARLTGQIQTKNESIEAISFLQKCGLGVNMPQDGTGAFLFLSQATKLSKQRIWAIVRNK